MKETRFALTENDEVVAAEKGKDLSAKQLFCLGCGEPVTHCAAFTFGPSSRIAHFRHLRNGTSFSCMASYESYLHNLAKRRFYKYYSASETFTVKREVSVKCTQAKYPHCTKELMEHLDLKQLYPYIELEKKDGQFIPDCRIYDKENNGIYIEIRYSSRASNKKIASGVPIMEISISSEEAILEGISTEGVGKDLSVNFYNFDSVPTQLSFNCGGICPHASYHTSTGTKSVPGIAGSAHPKESIDIVCRFLRTQDIGYAAERLDKMKEYYLCHIEFEDYSPSGFGWYRKKGKDGRFYYLKDQRYYLFLYDFQYYGIYHFGEWYIYSVDKEVVVIHGAADSMEGAYRMIEQMVPKKEEAPLPKKEEPAIQTTPHTPSLFD